MMDVRQSQNEVEDLFRDAILYALGARKTAVTSVAALRAFPTRGASGGSTLNDDALAAVTVAGVTTGWRWNSQSTATDDGMSVLQPNDVTANGRWLNFVSPLRIALTPGGDSAYLHEITAGPLKRVILLDRGFDDQETLALVLGQTPSVLIQATDDEPVSTVEASGRLLDVAYTLMVSVLDENFRDYRQAAQGSTFSGEESLGANGIDGLIQFLLTGTQLAQVVDGIRDVQPGRCSNLRSEHAQRRVERIRTYRVLATVQIPPAPNDSAPVSKIFAQQNLVALGEQTVAGNTYVVSGIVPTAFGPGLSKNIAAGSMMVVGEPLAYAGELATFAASSLTYRDLNPNGTLSFIATGLDEIEPAVTAGAQRVGVTQTDADGVVADRLIAASNEPYGSDNEIDL
jgi:hypothetical protein